MIRKGNVSSAGTKAKKKASPTTILVIQGSRRFAARVTELLSKDQELGASVEHVETLGEALERVSRARYNVVLLAIGRQVSRGFQALSVMHSRAPSLPIVVVTNGDDLDLGINAISLGAQDYLLKGDVTSQSLGRSIRYAIERQRSHHALPRVDTSSGELRDQEEPDERGRGRLKSYPPSIRDSLVFGDIYRADKILGLGAMGVVYFGIDTMLDREVAIKVLYTETSGENLDEIRFTREAKTLAAIEHPGIVPVYAYGKEGTSNYFVMKYIRGTSLESMLSNGSAQLGEILPELKQVFESLDYLHACGVFHRDLKPSNIIFNGEDHAMLVDFGVAKKVGRSRITNTSVLIGTPTYMPPEQAIAPHSVGPASDQYSLGVVVYEILCGRTPFMARSPVAVLFRLVNEAPSPIKRFNPSVSNALESAVMKAISKKPDDRYTSCGAFFQALVGAFRESSPPRGGRVGGRPPLPRRMTHRSQPSVEDTDGEPRLEGPSPADDTECGREKDRDEPERGLDAKEYIAEQWLDDLSSSSHRPEAASRLRRFGDILASSGHELWQSLCTLIKDRLSDPESPERLVEGARVLAFYDDEGREPFGALLSEVLGPRLTGGRSLQPAHLFESFAWISTPSELVTWKELITDPEPQCRILGLWALPFAHQALHHSEKLKASFKVVQMLFWASNDPDEQVAVTALRSLARIGIPEVVAPLIECYRSTSSAAIRLDAVEALLELATLNSSVIQESRAELDAEQAALDPEDDELSLKLETLLERLLPTVVERAFD